MNRLLSKQPKKKEKKEVEGQGLLKMTEAYMMAKKFPRQALPPPQVYSELIAPLSKSAFWGQCSYSSALDVAPFLPCIIANSIEELAP